MWQFRVESNIIPLRISIALPSSKRISHVRFLVLLPLLVFLLHEASIFFDIIMWYPRVTPDAENERGTAIAVAVAISHYQRCLSHIANVP